MNPGNTTPNLIDGKQTAEDIKVEIAAQVVALKAAGQKVPHLAAILVGHDGGSETYVRNKVLACERVGFQSTLLRFEDDITEVELLAQVDGLNRDPEIDGQPLPLPRRERRILEYLASNRGRRVTKTQVFNAIYGIFDEEVEENVVESHISKLRKKLREKLGHDPIDSKRFLGYRLVY